MAEKKKFPKSSGEEGRIRSEGIRELFLIRPGELPMKTETPPGKMDPFVMMEVVEYAFSLPATNPGNHKGRKHLLSEVYRNRHDIRMISKSRKGRIEIEKILSSQVRDELEEFGI